jgi:hypothetical protein
MKRNRRERRKALLYKLESVFRPRPDKSPLSEAELETAPPHFIEGELDGVIFVSVPETASHNSCQKLREIIGVLYGDKKQVVILTHNIELLKATKMDPNVAAAVLKTIQGSADPSKCELCGGGRSVEEEPATKAPRIITDIRH